MRLIDADVLKQHIDKLPALPDGNFAGNHSALKALINMQPTVQPEIIHCGECAFPYIRGKNLYCDHITGEEIMVWKDEYCSWGEKKHVENG